MPQVALNGFESAGMQKYIKWQNSVLTAAQMRSERFIEIPALHQTCVYRKQQVHLAAGAHCSEWEGSHCSEWGNRTVVSGGVTL